MRSEIPNKLFTTVKTKEKKPIVYTCYNSPFGDGRTLCGDCLEGDYNHIPTLTHPNKQASCHSCIRVVKWCKSLKS